MSGLSFKITSSIMFIKTFQPQISKLLKEIETLINSIPGIGSLTAITLIAEIGDIDGFVKPKHLVAFFSIDCAVNESGKFKGNQNKISKRGTRIGGKALYDVALASIRSSRNGTPINKVLLE